MPDFHPRFLILGDGVAVFDSRTFVDEVGGEVENRVVEVSWPARKVKRLDFPQAEGGKTA